MKSGQMENTDQWSKWKVFKLKGVKMNNVDKRSK